MKIHSAIGSIPLYKKDGTEQKTAYPNKCRCQQCYFRMGNYCIAFNKETEKHDTCAEGLKIQLELL